MKKIIITGGRDYTDKEKVFRILDKLSPDYIIVGDCPTGVDHFVASWFPKNRSSEDYPGVNIITYYADWEKHGKAAGPLRNHSMVDENLEAMLISFPGGKGTKDCTEYAAYKGLIVLKVLE